VCQTLGLPPALNRPVTVTVALLQAGGKSMNKTNTPACPHWVGDIRLQLNPLVGFGFEQATDLIPLLRSIGFRWLYLSPVMRCEKGSNHGYDTLDPNAIDDERGGKAEFERMLAVAFKHDMRVIWDLTHHQLRSDENPYWRGDAAIPRQQTFDIDPVTGENRGFWQHRHLAGVRVEDPAVFAEVNSLLLSYVGRGLVHGVRVDAADMLTDWSEFAERLSASVDAVRGDRAQQTKFPIIIETIVTPEESLPAGFDGTVGMEELADLSQVFIDGAGQRRLIEIWNGITRRKETFNSVQVDSARVHAAMTFGVEAQRILREFNIEGLPVSAVYSAMSSVPKRSHVTENGASGDDEKLVRGAQLPAALTQAWLSGRNRKAIGHLEQAIVATSGCGYIAASARFAANIGLNDAGNNPGARPLTVAELHRRHAHYAQAMPWRLCTRTTHDTSMSGDCRDMLKALTFRSKEWAAVVADWFIMNQPFKDAGAPHREDEYYMYQLLLSAGLIEQDRMEIVFTKKLREAGERSGWLEQPFRDDGGKVLWCGRNERYEQQCLDFYRRLCTAPGAKQFRDSFTKFRDELRRLAAQLTLSQLTVMLTCPGMGDIFQGDLLWLYRLIDPDNRCAADWACLNDVISGFKAGALPTYDTIKAWVIWQTLGVRERHESDFLGGKTYFKVRNAGRGILAYRRGKNVEVWVPTRPGLKLPERALQKPGWRNIFQPLEQATIELNGSPVEISLALLERCE
jgi:(1->4)-alpha-D-glucan 1-alpha-D-glucosylmutase